MKTKNLLLQLLLVLTTYGTLHGQSCCTPCPETVTIIVDGTGSMSFTHSSWHIQVRDWIQRQDSGAFHLRFVYYGDSVIVDTSQLQEISMVDVMSINHVFLHEPNNHSNEEATMRALLTASHHNRLNSFCRNHFIVITDAAANDVQYKDSVVQQMQMINGTVHFVVSNRWMSPHDSIAIANHYQPIVDSLDGSSLQFTQGLDLTLDKIILSKDCPDFILHGCDSVKTLEATNDSSIIAYHWTIGSLVDTTTTTPLLSHNFGTDTTAVIRLITEKNNCRDTIVKTVTIPPAFNADFVIDTTNYGCQTYIEAVATSPNINYTWWLGTSTVQGQNLGTDSTIGYWPNQGDYPIGPNGERYVTLSAYSNGCRDIVTKSVQVIQPSLNLSTNSYGCSKTVDLDVFIAQLTQDSLLYWEVDWGDGNDTSGGIGLMPMNITLNHTYDTTGIFFIGIFVTTQNGCIYTETIRIETYEGITPYTVDTNCVDTTITIVMDSSIQYVFVEINNVVITSTDTIVLHHNDLLFLLYSHQNGCTDYLSDIANLNCPDIILDVNIRSLTGIAKNRTNVLSWNNPQNDGIILQKSKDGILFTDVYLGSDDKFIDKEPFTVSYYRIKETNGDLTNVVAIENKTIQKKENITIFPNPIQTGEILSILGLEQDTEILLYNSLGQVVLKTVMQKEKIQVTDLSTGMYYLHIPSVGLCKKLSVYAK